MNTQYLVTDNTTCHGFNMGDTVTMDNEGRFHCEATGQSWEMHEGDYTVHTAATTQAMVQSLCNMGMLPTDAQDLLDTMRTVSVSFAALQDSINHLTGGQ